jgi:hypothetical protein
MGKEIESRHCIGTFLNGVLFSSYLEHNVLLILGLFNIKLHWTIITKIIAKQNAKKRSILSFCFFSGRVMKADGDTCNVWYLGCELQTGASSSNRSV